MSAKTTIVETLDDPGCDCEAFDHCCKLISIDVALATIRDAVSAVAEVEVLLLTKARGRVLAAPVLASSHDTVF